jgi:hypothetical protein
MVQYVPPVPGSLYKKLQPLTNFLLPDKIGESARPKREVEFGIGLVEIRAGRFRFQWGL